jgi:hypothetical protein
LDTFRKDKSISKVLARLRNIEMRIGEYSRRFGQRVRRLSGKITPPPSDAMQTKYFMEGLSR